MIDRNAPMPGSGWRVPLDGDEPDVPLDMANLAEDIWQTHTELADRLQALLGGMRIEARSVTCSTNASGVAIFLFEKPFSSRPVLIAVPGDSVGIDPNRVLVVPHESVTPATGLLGGFASNQSIVRVNYIAVGAA